MPTSPSAPDDPHPSPAAPPLCAILGMEEAPGGGLGSGRPVPCLMRRLFRPPWNRRFFFPPCAPSPTRMPIPTIH
eukprot:scaffold22470_cov91-Isochrysis_galbana.AAC.1